MSGLEQKRNLKRRSSFRNLLFEIWFSKSGETAFSKDVVHSGRDYVLSLPALGALGHVELHGLALLKALEASRLDRGEMHKNVFASLPADEAVALGVVEPLHCSLFCHVDTVPFQIDFTLERFGGTEGQVTGC